MRLGYEVDVDIGKEDPERRRPDFLIRAGDSTCLVEATVVIGDDAIRPADRTRVNQLYDAIERITVRDYLLDVVPIKVGQTTPGKRTIGRLLETWLRQLDYDHVLALRDSDQPRPTHTFRFDDWAVRVTASALLPDLRGATDSLFGSTFEGEGEAGDVRTFKRIDDISAMSRELRKKAGHYGKPDRPYVIAALCAGPFVNHHDIAQALIGRIGYRLGVDGRADGGYEPGGLWLGDQGPAQHSCVSGHDRSWVAAERDRSRATNALAGARARHPLGCTFPSRGFAFAEDAAVTELPSSRTIDDILGLRPGWPLH